MDIGRQEGRTRRDQRYTDSPDLERGSASIGRGVANQEEQRRVLRTRDSRSAESPLTLAREKRLFQALTFCLGEIGNGSYFWLMRGIIPIDRLAMFENKVKEVVDTDNRRAVW